MAQRINEQIGSLPAIESEAHFFAVGLEMLRAHFMPSANDTALQQRECGFDCVSVSVAVRVNLERMPDRLVLVRESKSLCNSTIDSKVICEKHIHVLADILADVLFQCAALYVLSMKESQLAAALSDSDDRLFLGSASASIESATATANIGFVYFNLAVEHRLAGFYHRRTDSVAKEPSRLVADSKRALNLTGAHTLLGLTEQVGRSKPLIQRQVSVIENRSGSDGELIAA